MARSCLIISSLVTPVRDGACTKVHIAHWKWARGSSGPAHSHERDAGYSTAGLHRPQHLGEGQETRVESRESGEQRRLWEGQWRQAHRGLSEAPYCELGHSHHMPVTGEWVPLHRGTHGEIRALQGVSWAWTRGSEPWLLPPTQGWQWRCIMPPFCSSMVWWWLWGSSTSPGMWQPYLTFTSFVQGGLSLALV